MGFFRSALGRIGKVLDRIDERVDRPAKSGGTFSQGSEQMIDDDMASEKGRAVSNKRSGFGRGL